MLKAIHAAVTAPPYSRTKRAPEHKVLDVMEDICGTLVYDTEHIPAGSSLKRQLATDFPPWMLQYTLTSTPAAAGGSDTVVMKGEWLPASSSSHRAIKFVALRLLACASMTAPRSLLGYHPISLARRKGDETVIDDDTQHLWLLIFERACHAVLDEHKVEVMEIIYQKPRDIYTKWCVKLAKVCKPLPPLGDPRRPVSNMHMEL